MNITDLPTLNLIWEGCCGCALPECAENEIKCQSQQHRTNCADDDFTDEHDLWERKTIAHDEWQVEHDGFPAAHAAWVIAHAAWAAEDPCDRGEEPEEPVDPDEPDAPGAEPEEPEDYNDYEHDCHAPFTEPEGEPGDDIPTLYGRRKGIAQPLITGSSWAYSYSDFGFASSESLTIGTYTAWWVDGSGTAVETSTGNVKDHILGTCDPIDNVAANFVGPLGPDPYYADGVVSIICEATERGTETVYTVSEGSTTPRELLGCANIVADPPEDSTRGYYFELTDTIKDVLSEPKTKSSLIARAIDNIPDAWPDEHEGGSCSASTVAVWPKISDFYGGADPEADPPVEAAWVERCDIASGFASVPETYAIARKARYKMGVPLLYQAHRLWIDLHAAWEACEALGCIPNECGDEPVEPKIYHYYAIQWDVVFFPKKWEEWRVLWLAWKAAVAAKEAWDACELLTPGECGEEPTVPDDPGDPLAEAPVFVDENLFWEWTGGETEAEQYEADWHVIGAPTSEGESRIVNRQVKCWQSTRLGVPPTPVGEIYNPEDYPE